MNMQKSHEPLLRTPLKASLPAPGALRAPRVRSAFSPPAAGSLGNPKP